MVDNAPFLTCQHAGLTIEGYSRAAVQSYWRIAELKIGDSLDVAHYRLTLDGLFSRDGSNYHDLVGRFTVRRMNGEFIGVMEPTRRSFPNRSTTVTEAALMTRGVSQLYLSLGDPAPNGSVAVRLYFKPHVLLIWLGGAIMFAGGALSLSDRRLRVGAPRPAKARAVLQAAE